MRQEMLICVQIKLLIVAQAHSVFWFPISHTHTQKMISLNYIGYILPTFILLPNSKFGARHVLYLEYLTYSFLFAKFYSS